MYNIAFFYAYHVIVSPINTTIGIIRAEISAACVISCAMNQSTLL